ncbi:MAG TPA: MBL fold metallo-hydrolase [Candidatus Limnocylindrales bacterium]
MRAPRTIALVGHSTVLVELDGVRLLTDPILRPRVGPLARIAPPPAPEVLDRIDAVLISHLHWDHFDDRSVRHLGRHVRLIVPQGAAEHVRSRGFSDVEELPAGVETRVGRLVVRATPAAHSGFRPPLGPRAEAAGYFVGGSSRLYFAGDTDLFPGMADIDDRLDVALLPVWGWGPRLGPDHLDPGRAAEAVNLLRPRLAVPIHFGSLWPLGLKRPTVERRMAPALRFAELSTRRVPAVDVRVGSPGAPHALI